MSKPTETEDAVYDGQTFEAMSPGPTKVVLAGLFHENPSLIEAEQTAAEWQATIDKFLKSERS